MVLKCLVIDDEEIACKGLERYCHDINFIQVEKICSSAAEALEVLNANRIDLVFLDIQMPKMTGLDFLKSLASPPLVIITTAFPDFALEGFELDVIDYLVKPFSFERFLKACNKAKEYLALKNAGSNSINEESFFVKANGKIEKILLAEILFVQAMENYVYIHTTKKKYLTLVSLKNIERNLPGNEFIKVQKSFLVSIQKIDSTAKNMIRIGDHEIPISRKWKTTILNRIIKHKILKR